MKYAEYVVENNTIEFLNNRLIGVETILLNGKKVSSKFSFFGARHNFNINEEDYYLQVSTDFSKAGGASSYVYKGATRLDLVNKISKTQKYLLNMKFILSCIVGGLIGGYFGFYGMDYLLTVLS